MMKKQSIYMIVLIIGFVLITNCIKNRDSITGYIDNREIGNTQKYFVYSTILNSFIEHSDPLFVVNDSTVFYDFSDNIEYIKSHFPDLQDETINKYLSINQQSIELKGIPDLAITCHLIDHENVHKWKEYYPNADALIHFSRVGFNTDKNQALVYCSDYSAPLCASGNLIFLNKKNNEWIIVKSLMLWIS